MVRRGNPYDNAKMESFLKTQEVESVYALTFETAEDISEHLPCSIDEYEARRLHSALGYLSPIQFQEQKLGPTVKSAA